MIKRTATNILMQVFIMWVVPVNLISSLINIQLLLPGLLLALVLCLYAKTVPYIIEKQGKYFYKYSAFFPGKPLENVVIEGNKVTIDGKRRQIYGLEWEDTLALIKEEVERILQKEQQSHE